MKLESNSPWNMIWMSDSPAPSELKGKIKEGIWFRIPQSIHQYVYSEVYSQLR